MKNWTITSSLVTLSLGALLSACGAAESSATNDQPGLESNNAAQLGDNSAALTMCDDPQYDHWRYISALAVAAGNELGRWNIADFTLNNGVQLSSSGLARCKNGCMNVQTILALQNTGTGVIPRLDSGLLKQYLTGFYTDQVSYQNANGFNEHQLVPASVSTASCGYRYWFRDTLVKYTGTTPVTAAVSGKCMDIASTADQANIIQKACSGATQQAFVVDPVLTGGYRLKNSVSGKCVVNPNVISGATLIQQSCQSGQPSQTFGMVDLGNGKFQLKSFVQSSSPLCVEVMNSSTTDGAQLRVVNCNSTSTAQQFQANVTTQTVDNPNQSTMINFLRFVGGGTQNPYIQFQSNAQQVSIDPTGALVDGGATGQTGSCTAAASAVDSTHQIAGKCCTYNGVYGTFQVTAWNPSLYYCK